MDSTKLIKTGFKPLYNSADAAKELKKEFEKGFKPKTANWNLNYLLEKKKIIKTQ